ncbi:Uu.00g019070.m01.CDS01 [Anthostomella pinea]|uniref:Translation initiation factor eIF2B subunit alpha n=1 Tax=Anthostomella pinea TaxID=933095 RepID=A0AAI8YQN4_9PEZI|nr:Uu.00g019070.m01.CDS01 [Anthostomella pinea]
MPKDEEKNSAAPRHLPIRSNPDMENFDIVKTYNRLLADDPELTMPVAAIEALIEALGASSAMTVFETMDLVKTQSEKLRAAFANPVALSHGTNLFQQYLVMSLKQPGEAASNRNFEVVRQHLMRNGRLFAARAKEAREKIASVGRQYIHDNTTILTHGGSRVVGTLLGRAAENLPGDPKRRFKVIYVVNDARRTESNRVVAALRARGVPVATIDDSAVAYCMPKADMVLVGAEAVMADGGVVSRLGTYSIAVLARAHHKDFFVAAEQHKIGKTFPLGQFDAGFEQNLLDFHASKAQEGGGAHEAPAPVADPVDYTPPEYIEAFFADHGVKAPSAIAKEVIDMLF